MEKSGIKNPFYGKKHSEETKKRWSEIRKGRKLSDEHKRKLSESHLRRKEKYGYINSPETRKKLSESNKGRVVTAEQKQKSSQAQKGKSRPSLKEEKNGKWKGDGVGYSGLHIWLRKKYGKANKCEHCGLKDIPIGMKIYFDWANKSGNYKRDRNDWLKLCRKCHYKYDNQKERKYNLV